MTIQLSNTQRITLDGGDPVVHLDRWTGAMTVTCGVDSVTLVSERHAMENAVRAYISAARYVQAEDADEIRAYLGTIVEAATEAIRGLQERFPELESIESGVTG